MLYRKYILTAILSIQITGLLPQYKPLSSQLFRPDVNAMYVLKFIRSSAFKRRESVTKYCEEILQFQRRVLHDSPFMFRHANLLDNVQIFSDSSANSILIMKVRSTHATAPPTTVPQNYTSARLTTVLQNYTSARLTTVL